ncbi:MAG: hypothetical protein RJB13_2281 [Pseudomonadota bacterium]
MGTFASFSRRAATRSFVFNALAPKGETLVSQNSQLHLTNDSFLYACQSEFAARTKKDGSFKSHLRFDPFLVGLYQRPNSATWQDFVQLTTDIIKHHFTVTPQFRRKEPLNLDTVSFFTCSIATLFADLETACKEMFGTNIPVIPSEPPEYSPEAPVAKSLLNSRNAFLHQLNASVDLSDEFVPFPEGGDPNTHVQFACEIWDSLADVIHQIYGEYADLAMGFAYWKYQETTQKQDIDWRVRPPVGEAFAKAFRPLQRASRNDRGPAGSGRGDRGPARGDRGPARGDRGPARGASGPARGEQNDPSKRPSRDTRTEEVDQLSARPQRAGNKAATTTEGSGGRERSNRDSGPRGQRGREPRHDNRDSGVTSEKQLEVALQEVYRAVESLKTAENQKEIALTPSNSFIRRQQHSLAVDLGFDTESRGEGRERGVVIRRPEPLH